MMEELKSQLETMGQHRDWTAGNHCHPKAEGTKMEPSGWGHQVEAGTAVGLFLGSWSHC